jgi:hypothetical protein
MVENQETQETIPEVVNVKALSEDLKTMKQMLEAMRPAEPGPKGHVEESAGSGTIEEAVKVTESKLRDSFKEFLKTAEIGKTFKLEETIGAVTATNAIPTKWTAEPEVLSPEGADGYFLTDRVVRWKNDVKGQPGDTVYVKTFAAVAGTAIISGTEPTFTASTVSRVPVTLVQKGHGFYISKANLEDIDDADVDAMHEQSKNGILRAVDDYFLSQLQVDAAMAAAGTITEAGAMAATVLTKMWGSIMAGSYKPGAVICSPVQYASLLQDDQFTNAATRGKKDIIETGVIGNYLGMDIVPLIQGTLNAGGGTYRSFVLAKGAIAGAIKRDIEFEREYYVKDQRNYFVGAVRFGGTPVHTSGIGLILTVEA